MERRSVLSLLGASLAVAGCFLPWSCRQVGDLGWRCTSARVLRYAMQNSGGGFITRFLTLTIVFFACVTPHFVRRSKIVALIGSAALVLLSAYHFVTTLTARIQDNDGFVVLTGLTAAIVCIGALLTLAAGMIDQRAVRHSAVEREAMRSIEVEKDVCLPAPLSNICPHPPQ